MSPRPLVVHYHRPRGDYAGWQLWAWDRATESLGGPYEPVAHDDFGLRFEVLPEHHGGGPALGLLPRRGEWMDKDRPERVWQSGRSNRVWLLQGVAQVFTAPPDTAPRLLEARLDSWDRLRVRLSLPLSGPPADLRALCRLEGGDGAPVPVLAAATRTGPGEEIDELDVTLARPLEPELDPFWLMTFEVAGYRPVHLTVDALLDCPEFIDDGWFGTRCNAGSTAFRVFAPTAAGVEINLYAKSHGGKPKRVALKRGARGVWATSVPRDLAGTCYTLSVRGLDPRFDPEHEIIDPWARCTTGHAGRGLILPPGTNATESPDFPAEDAILYELHLRDFSIASDSGVSAKGKYLGAVEAGTHLPGNEAIATGIDHLVELGVNVIQLMPVQDFENDEKSPAYNWGYMPVHFNSPDGWYASSPTGPARVMEAREMVDGFHRRGLKVVLDVVLNHTAEKAPEKVYSFEGVVPGYYYRRWSDGSLANGSACGNEFRSEAPMARRFLIDMLKHWVTDYGVDGFRFDLMGLIDLETLTLAAAELRRIRPDILLYGEPWTAAATPIRPTQKGMQRGRGFGVFNDAFRDAVKGGVFDTQPGFVQGGQPGPGLRGGLVGGIEDFAAAPLESVNYVECHDNETLWDHLVSTTGTQADLTDEEREAMHRLGGALVLLAAGIPFLHAGQEMRRTKQGEANSYRAPDTINQIRWSWKVEHAALVAWHRGLIALRRAHVLFRPRDAETVRRGWRWLPDLPQRLVGCLIQASNESGDSWARACLLFNGGAEAESIDLPPGGWQLFADGTRAGLTPLHGGRRLTGPIVVPGRSALVLGQPTGSDF